MGALQWTQLMITVGGICLQPYAYTPLKRFLYKIYAFIGWGCTLSLFIFQLLDILINVENQDEFSENCALTLIILNIILKLKIFSTHRGSILRLIAKLDENLFLPTDKQEMDIRSRYDRIVDLTSKVYTVIIEFFVIATFAISVTIDYKDRKLISRVWLPYDYTILSHYVLSTFHQFIVAMYGVPISVACDSLYSGFILQICCQFEILEHRIKTVTGDELFTMNRFAKIANEKFSVMMAFQFFVSTLVICLNFYRMSYAENIGKLMAAAALSVCVFSQIFYYCFYGHLAKAKSTDFSVKIFDSNWPSWSESCKKVLLMIIRRSRTPIEFTSMHIVSLNLESFMSLIKTSYSAFNLMQTNR